MRNDIVILLRVLISAVFFAILLKVDVRLEFWGIAYMGLGMLIKYGDIVFDDLRDVGEEEKLRVHLLGLTSAMAMGTLMIVDYFSFIVFTGMIGGLLATRKIDSRDFKVATVFLSAFFVFSMVSHTVLYARNPPLTLLWVGIIAFCSALDEVGNGRAEGRGGVIARILYYRPFMKLGVVVMSIIAFRPAYALVFLLFDMGYELMAELFNHYVYLSRFSQSRSPQRAPCLDQGP
ncbi:hypothetical protein [Palaeococcus ferrophilus]|uniref:hypothetical protein n=1 Tax=Palaeococcus ferrophilus TaxID=83868 RepID=UPI00064E5C18|nr:hypothetical protein [Palaeococcus ferrophilus]